MGDAYLAIRVIVGVVCQIVMVRSALAVARRPLAEKAALQQGAVCGRSVWRCDMRGILKDD